MDEIFIAIMEQIAQELPELSLIDEDYGQLEMGAEEDQYPVTFPCVLIGNTDSDWHDLGYGAQKSESVLTVRLAIDCYDDTSYASGTYDKVRERQQLAGKLYKSLQCLQCTDNASPLLSPLQIYPRRKLSNLFRQVRRNKYIAPPQKPRRI